MSFVRNLLSTNDRSKQCASEDLVSQGIISPEEAETLTTMCVPVDILWITDLFLTNIRCTVGTGAMPPGFLEHLQRAIHIWRDSHPPLFCNLLSGC